MCDTSIPFESCFGSQLTPLLVKIPANAPERQENVAQALGGRPHVNDLHGISGSWLKLASALAVAIAGGVNQRA